MINKQVEKKDHTIEKFNTDKIIVAIHKSADRVMEKFTPEEEAAIRSFAEGKAAALDENPIPIEDIHKIVEAALELYKPSVAKSYKDYRNYKKDFVHMLDKVYQYEQKVRYLGDKSNANTDSALVSTQRSLIYNELSSELYKKFFLNSDERQAAKDGYIYIHDRSARLDTINCCLFNIAEVLKGGFEMGNVWYNEPKTLDTAFDVIGDIVMSAAAMQYGGFTMPEIDTILIPYAENSFQMYQKEYFDLMDEVPYDDQKDIMLNHRAELYAMRRLRRDFEQGFQGWEYKFNTVGSSRGDYPFIAMSLGANPNKFAAMAASIALEVRKGGQGKKGFKKPVLFPKITFLYDEN